MLIGFTLSRRSGKKRHWSDQTPTERFLLSLSFAAAIQLVYVTILPGWIVGVYVVGKGKFSQTPLGNEAFATVAIFSNIIIYFPLFFLLLKLLSRFFSKRALKMK